MMLVLVRFVMTWISEFFLSDVYIAPYKMTRMHGLERSNKAQPVVVKQNCLCHHQYGMQVYSSDVLHPRFLKWHLDIGLLCGCLSFQETSM